MFYFHYFYPTEPWLHPKVSSIRQHRRCISLCNKHNRTKRVMRLLTIHGTTIAPLYVTNSMVLKESWEYRQFMNNYSIPSPYVTNIMRLEIFGEIIDNLWTTIAAASHSGSRLRSKICVYISNIMPTTTHVYSVSSCPGSDIARLFAKSSSKSHAPSEIAYTSSLAHKTKSVCMRLLAASACLRRCQEMSRWSVASQETTIPLCNLDNNIAHDNLYYILLMGYMTGLYRVEATVWEWRSKQHFKR